MDLLTRSLSSHEITFQKDARNIQNVKGPEFLVSGRAFENLSSGRLGPKDTNKNLAQHTLNDSLDC